MRKGSSSSKVPRQVPKFQGCQEVPRFQVCQGSLKLIIVYRLLFQVCLAQLAASVIFSVALTPEPRRSGVHKSGWKSSSRFVRVREGVRKKRLQINVFMVSPSELEASGRLRFRFFNGCSVPWIPSLHRLDIKFGFSVGFLVRFQVYEVPPFQDYRVPEGYYGINSRPGPRD